MFKYFWGFIKNIFNPAVSLFAIIDYSSFVDKRARVNRLAKVFHSNLGKYSYIGKGSSLIYAEVGSFCSIAANVRIGLGTHDLTKLSTSPLFTEKENGTGYTWTDQNKIPYEKVIIGNDVWIGERAMIMGGLSVGNGAVIGAGAVVTRDIPPYAIVGGIPARIIRYRFDLEIVNSLESISWWDLPEEVLRKNVSLFQENEITKDLLERLSNL